MIEFFPLGISFQPVSFFSSEEYIPDMPFVSMLQIF